MTRINKEIFREYDIRGIVGKDIDGEVYYTLGKAYGAYMAEKGAKTLSVGRDCRLSSPELSSAFVHGLNSTGLDVLDIGMVSTPMLYFSLYSLDVQGGAMITASHNPGEYNGIKLSSGKDSIFGEEIKKIARIAGGGAFPVSNGTATQADVKEAYIDYLLHNIDIEPGLRIAADYGNGMVGVAGPEVFEGFGCEVTALYPEPDGTFPNHHPDPTVEENLVDMIHSVKSENLELGVGFDGDGDRVGVVDENGNIIWGDMLVLIFARDILANSPGSTIIGDVKCSNRLFSGIDNAGGNAIMWKTGHSLMKSKMKEESAALAGEMSGHIFFADRFFGYDDALYAALRLLEIVSKSRKSLSRLLEDVPAALSTPEIRVDCPEEIKFTLVEEVKKELSKNNDTIDIDGVRVEFPDGWGLIRASNTQPALVLRFEARSQGRLDEIRSLVESELETAKKSLSA